MLHRPSDTLADNGAIELTEIHRFTHPWEAEASTRLRAGDTTALAAYDEHARLVGGTADALELAATRAWLADTLTGRESLLLVGSNEQASHLCAQIRAELIRLHRVEPFPLAVLRDGNQVSVGDWVQARRNDPTIPVHGPGMVTNRATYQVLGAAEDGSTVRVRGTNGAIAVLPATYVAEHLTLAYASTVHAAQGRTVDTCHALIDTRADRRSVYVAMTRGREANTAYVVSVHHPDAHDPERLTSTACDQLAQVLDRTDDSGATAAEVTRRAGLADARDLAHVGTLWDLITADEARHRHTATLTGWLSPDRATTITTEPGFPRLLRALRAAELAGHHTEAVLREAVAERTLAGANSMSDVLRARIHRALPGRTPERLIDPHDWTTWATPEPGPVVDYIGLLAKTATDRHHQLGHQTLADPPAWAVQHLGPPPAEPAEQNEWGARATTIATYRELRGLPADDTQQPAVGPAPAREQVLHRALWSHAHTAIGHPTHELDHTHYTDAELWQVRESYQRELTWGAPDVRQELRDTRYVADGYARDAILWAAEAELLPDGTPQRAQADADVASARYLATTYQTRTARLETQLDAHHLWRAATQDLRDHHADATRELARRGLLEPDHHTPPAAAHTEHEPDQSSSSPRARADHATDRQREHDVLTNDPATAAPLAVHVDRLTGITQEVQARCTVRDETFQQVHDFVAARERAKTAEMEAYRSRNYYYDDLDHHSHTHDQARDDDFGMDL